MEGHRANLADVVIGDGVVLHSAALADPEFESENGIGHFLDDPGAVSVVANAIEINAHGSADISLEDVAQFANPVQVNPGRLMVFDNQTG